MKVVKTELIKLLRDSITKNYEQEIESVTAKEINDVLMRCFRSGSFKTIVENEVRKCARRYVEDNLFKSTELRAILIKEFGKLVIDGKFEELIKDSVKRFPKEFVNEFKTQMQYCEFTETDLYRIIKNS